MVAKALNRCSCLVRVSFAPCLHRMTQAMLRVSAVDRSLFDSNWSVMPFIAMESLMKSFLALKSW